MKWCIEDYKGDVFEVTRLFDERGYDTNELLPAVACLIKLPGDALLPAIIETRPVHRLQ